MDLLKMHYFEKNYKLIFVLLFIFFNVSCKKEEPNPELRDPIYSDLVSIHKENKKLLDDEKKLTVGLESAAKEARPRSSEKRIAKKTLRSHRKKLVKYGQLEHYYRIHSERRSLVGRKAYRIAFRKGEPWPDPKEFEHYKTNKRLKNANLNWQARVPKLFKENPNYDPNKEVKKGKKEKKK